MTLFMHHFGELNGWYLIKGCPFLSKVCKFWEALSICYHYLLVTAVNKETLFEKRKSGKELKVQSGSHPKAVMAFHWWWYCMYCKLFCNEASAWKLYSRMKSLQDHEATAYHKFADGAVQLQYIATVHRSCAPVYRSAAGMSQQYRD